MEDDTFPKWANNMLTDLLNLEITSFRSNIPVTEEFIMWPTCFALLTYAKRSQ